MNEKEFKDNLEAQLLMLLDKGNWVAEQKVEISSLSYLGERELILFFNNTQLNVVCFEHIVKMNSSALLHKASEVFHAIMEYKEKQTQQKLQTSVISTMDKLVNSLEPM
jgi:hypothetical protein